MTFPIIQSESIIPISKQITEKFEELKQLIQPADNFMMIGHRIGEYKKYPVNVNKRKFIYHYKNTIALMENAFENTGLNGIELDVRIQKGNSDSPIFIVHDKIERGISEESIEYLNRNTLAKLFRVFIDKGYYKDRKIYIEIKLAGKIFHNRKKELFPDIVNHSEMKLIAKLFATLDEIVYSSPDPDAVQKSIGLISFSTAALHYFFTFGGDKYKYYLITTTDQFLKKTISRSMFYTPLTEKELTKIRYCEWLSGIWFDPVHISDPVSTFLELNSYRKNKLEFYVSTYGMKFSKLLRKFQTKEKLPVAGMIFDIEP